MAASLTRQQVLHVAKLANLTLTGDEVEVFAKQLGDVIDYVGQLEEVDTQGVSPTYQVIDGVENVMREDVVTPSLSQEEALSQARRTHNGYFLTKGVFDEG